jgi:hypothetical protein
LKPISSRPSSMKCRRIACFRRPNPRLHRPLSPFLRISCWSDCPLHRILSDQSVRFGYFALP